MNTPLIALVHDRLRAVPDYPKPGVVFQDITPLLSDQVVLRQIVVAMAIPFVADRVTHVLGIESRGFILGSAVALELGAGFVPARKPGKLPRTTVREEYLLEYGTDALEVHADAFGEGARVLIVDDVIATGGTAAAAGTLVDRLGADLVGWTFLLQIAGLGGLDRLATEDGRRPAHVLCTP